jgi:hypothetical protein
MNSLEKNNAAPSSEFQENLEILRQTYFFSGLHLKPLRFSLIFVPEKISNRESTSFTRGKMTVRRSISSAEKPDLSALTMEKRLKFETVRPESF